MGSGFRVEQCSEPMRLTLQPDSAPLEGGWEARPTMEAVGEGSPWKVQRGTISPVSDPSSRHDGKLSTCLPHHTPHTLLHSDTKSPTNIKSILWGTPEELPLAHMDTGPTVPTSQRIHHRKAGKTPRSTTCTEWGGTPHVRGALPGCKSWLHDQPVECPWASRLTSLCLSFLLCKVWTTKPSTSWGHGKH